MNSKMLLFGAGMAGMAHVISVAAPMPIVVVNEAPQRHPINVPPVEFEIRNIDPAYLMPLINEHSNSGVDRNQRQYRKLCRQNPWMYRSKKLRKRN